MKALGIIAGSHDECCSTVGTDTEELEKFRNRRDEEGFDPFVEFSELIIESADAVRQRGERCLGGRHHLVTGTSGSKLDPLRNQCLHRKSLETATELLRRRKAEVAHLDEGLDSGLASRTLGDHEHTDCLDRTALDLGCPVARPLCAARAASTASRGSDLPLRRRFCRSGRSTSMRATQVASQSGSIGTRSFDADLGHVSKGLEPAEQRLVTGSISRKALRSEHATKRIKGGGDMNIAVGIDTTGDSTHSF
jgi:hypothetical protein